MSDPMAQSVEPQTSDAYAPTREQARKAALYVAWRLGATCGDVLDALGLRDAGEAHDRTHHRDPSGKSVPNTRPPDPRRQR